MNEMSADALASVVQAHTRLVAQWLEADGAFGVLRRYAAALRLDSALRPGSCRAARTVAHIFGTSTAHVYESVYLMSG
jgi:hypothetical protein